MEFALTLILLMGMILFFFQLTLVFSFGSYAHYATFMSARAYLSAGKNPTDQMKRATNLAASMLKKSVDVTGVDKFPPIAKGVGGSGDITGLDVGPGSNYKDGERTLSWMQGVRYTFKSRLFLIPFGGSSQGTGGGGANNVGGKTANSVTLTSESWLGKEPSDEECQTELGKYDGIVDNGC